MQFVRDANDAYANDMRWYLRSKIGVWQMPLFKFLQPEIWRLKIFVLIGWKRLKYQKTRILDLRYQNCEWCKDVFTEGISRTDSTGDKRSGRMSQSVLGRESVFFFSEKQVYAPPGNDSFVRKDYLSTLSTISMGIDLFNNAKVKGMKLYYRLSALW